MSLDCGDTSCVFATDKSGQRTNGGCRCFDKTDRRHMRLLRQEFAELRGQVQARATMVEVFGKALAELSVLKADQGNTPDKRRAIIFHDPLLVQMREVLNEAKGT